MRIFCLVFDKYHKVFHEDSFSFNIRQSDKVRHNYLQLGAMILGIQDNFGILSHNFLLNNKSETH